jgi:hypothetical protein
MKLHLETYLEKLAMKKLTLKMLPQVNLWKIVMENREH